MQAWKCQFDKPTISTLIGELGPESGQFIQDLRGLVLKATKKKPKIEWLGMSWRWSETTDVHDGVMLLGLHLVYDPSAPRVGMSFSTAFFEKHPPHTLPKLLHAGLGLATCVGHQSWCEWSVDSQDMVEAIIEVIKLADGT